jgi:asparagine synthase (glutamine-hydrolysing)
MSMANSLELRCPLADHRIQELGLSIPFAWKYRRGKTKWILRQAMKGILPASVLEGRKIGFNPPVPQWINRELKPLISDLLSPRAVEQRGLFRPQAISNLLEDHFEQRRDNALKLWGLLMLELWFRMYIDQSWDSEAAISRHLEGGQLAGAAAGTGRLVQ